MRPILAMNNSPYHKVARWLVDLIRPFRNAIARHSLNDTFHLIREIDGINIKNTNMFSVDVQSLFTNVPLPETVDFLCQSIKDAKFHLPMPVELLHDMLLLCTENVTFSFQGQQYKQCDGIAMGSPLGPLLSDVFMTMIEQNASGAISNPDVQ